jgi:hypothetical protein
MNKHARALLLEKNCYGGEEQGVGLQIGRIL